MNGRHRGVERQHRRAVAFLAVGVVLCLLAAVAAIAIAAATAGQP